MSNCTDFSIATNAPSFTVTNITAPSTILYGTHLPITATIENVGTASGAARVTFTITITSTGDQVGQFDVTTDPIDIGTSSDIYTDMSMPEWPVGDYTLCATVTVL
jgi:hypothetical protein